MIFENDSIKLFAPKGKELRMVLSISEDTSIAIICGFL